ncbi:unnamed protein product [Closterium sp. NIES-54]
MDAEMASWKSTGTYVDEVPPPGANIVSGMWIFRVKRPSGSPPVFKARYVAQGFSQRQGVDYFQTFSPIPKMTTLRVLLHVAAQRDYELHSLDFSTAFLQGSLHEEIWLRRPPGFTGSFPPGTQWSLQRPVYSLRQAPREWHDTLRTTLAALGFAPSTADPSLFLRTDTSLPPFYIRGDPRSSFAGSLRSTRRVGLEEHVRRDVLSTRLQFSHFEHQRDSSLHFLHHHRSSNTKMRLMLKTNNHRHHLLLPPLIIKNNSSGSHHRLHHNNDNNHLHPIYILLFNPLLLTSRTSSNSNILPTLTLQPSLTPLVVYRPRGYRPAALLHLPYHRQLIPSTVQPPPTQQHTPPHIQQLHSTIPTNTQLD